MAFTMVRDDITKARTDAIVNAANSSLAAGGGVCGAIFAAAGHADLERACGAIGHCDVGNAVITPGFALPAKYVIHAVGPIWQGGHQNEENLLKSCYRNALLLAVEHGCGSVAFPLISAGIYGYPKAAALKCAMEAIGDFLFDHDVDVTLVIFDRDVLSLGEKLFAGIQSYIDDCYVDQNCCFMRRNEAFLHDLQLREQREMREACSAPPPLSPAPAFTPSRPLTELLNSAGETFSEMLLRLIDEKGLSDVDAYKRAHIDRRLFSKIRSNREYTPGKATVLSFALALELNLDDTRDLLGVAGYALSHSSKFDIIIEYFIGEGIYDIFTVNEALFAFDQRILG